MTQRRTGEDRETEDRPGIGRFGTRLLEGSENVVYAGIAVFLVGTALVCLALAGKTAWGLTTDFTEQPILDLLDILLLVFIVVELLFAVRTTVEKRELLAEPFLLVGIIASIKEIVVLSVESAKEVGNGAEFTTASSRSPSSASWCCSWASRRSCSGARNASPTRATAARPHPSVAPTETRARPRSGVRNGASTSRAGRR